MHFKYIVFILVGIMINGLMATRCPLTRVGAETTARSSSTVSEKAKRSIDGHLVYYGLSDDMDTLSVRADEERPSACPTTASPKCDMRNGARNELCYQLVAELQSNSQIPVPQKPRQICYRGSARCDEYCCISWHDVVPDLVKGGLVGYANTILSQCTSNGITGKIHNVMVNETCTDVCLSNRGNHC